MPADGILSGGSGIVTAGNGTPRMIIGDMTGTPTVGTMTDGRPCYVFVAAATQPMLAREFTSSKTAGTARIRFEVSNATPSSTVIFGAIVPNSANQGRIEITTGGVLRLHLSGVNAQTGPTIVANRAYEIEWQLDVSTSPRVAHARVLDTVTGTWTTFTDSSSAIAASTIYALYWGIISGPTSGFTIKISDVAMFSDNSIATDWLVTPAERVVKILRPNRDGNHSYTTGDFRDTAGTNIATNSTTVYQLLDETDQNSTADFVRQSVIRSTGYIEIGFESLPAGYTPLAVAVNAVFHASSTGANTISVKATDDGGSNVADLMLNNDVSDTTAHFRQLVMSTPPSGGSWDVTKLSTLFVRVGYSTDVTDIPYIDSLSLEVLCAYAVAGVQFFGGGFF